MRKIPQYSGSIPGTGGPELSSATLLLQDVVSTALTTPGYQLISFNCRSLLESVDQRLIRARLFPGCAAVFFSSFLLTFFLFFFSPSFSSYLFTFPPVTVVSGG